MTDLDDFDLSRALTVTQPWGGLLATGIKPIENRKQKIAPRGLFGKRFAIHASREIDPDVYERIYKIAPELYVHTFTEAPGELSTDAAWYKLSRVTSAIIGVVTLEPHVIIGDDPDSLHRMSAKLGELVGTGALRWYFGPIGYVLSHAVVLPRPVPTRGWQGFWSMPPAVRADVRAQLVARAA